MRAQTVRAGAATAAVPAVLVVIAHLAWEWHQHADTAQRQTLAFNHGVALAVILAVLLVGARLALALERGGGRPIADAVAVAGVIAVLAHLAASWRDQGNVDSVRTLLEHLAALLAVGAAAVLARRLERRRGADAPQRASNRRSL